MKITIENKEQYETDNDNLQKAVIHHSRNCSHGYEGIRTFKNTTSYLDTHGNLISESIEQGYKCRCGWEKKINYRVIKTKIIKQ